MSENTTDQPTVAVGTADTGAPSAPDRDRLIAWIEDADEETLEQLLLVVAGLDAMQFDPEAKSYKYGQDERDLIDEVRDTVTDAGYDID